MPRRTQKAGSKQQRKRCIPKRDRRPNPWMPKKLVLRLLSGETVNR